MISEGRSRFCSISSSVGMFSVQELLRNAKDLERELESAYRDA